MKIFITFIVLAAAICCSLASAPHELVQEITDEKWDQIQKGQWLLGFFDRDTKDSLKLEEDWQVFALKCKEQGINTGKVSSPQNPGLSVRFLVTVFPKVFYVRNGVAHEVSKPNREILMNLIKDKTWSSLKAVNFLNNPFSIQMSLLSHLFIHAVNLYNYEDAIVQKFVSFPSATDIVFGLTFIVIGTIFGLLLTVVFAIISVVLSDKTKESEDDCLQDEDDSHDQDKNKENKDAKQDVDSSDSSQVKKRK